MANSTSTSLVLFQPDDPFDAKTKGAIAAFLAGYGGATFRSYRTVLRISAEWCTENRVAVLEAKRAHIEIFGREMESAGKMRSTVARRMSTIAGFFKYCHDEGLLDRNPAANVRRPKVDHESRTLVSAWMASTCASDADSPIVWSSAWMEARSSPFSSMRSMLGSSESSRMMSSFASTDGDSVRQVATINTRVLRTRRAIWRSNSNDGSSAH